MTAISRREYLASTAAATVAVGAVESSFGFFANETINVACLGTGGRCQHLMQRLSKIEGVKITAVCDVWDARRADSKKLADPSAIESPDFRTLLDRKDIDAVLIGAPDHWHVPMTIAACQAGKDVYVEKPLTHSVSENDSVIQAVRSNKRVVQIGTQQRSIPHLIEAKQLVQSGKLGKINKIHMSWNRNQERWQRPSDYNIKATSVDWDKFLGNAPKQPFDPYRLSNWRWFWDFGGGIFTDLMVHWYDTARWMMNLPEAKSAVSVGHQFATKGLWETPDTVQTILDFGLEGPQAHFDGTFVNHHGRAELVLMGTDATLICDRGAYQLVPQRGKSVAAQERNDSKNPLRGLDFYDDIDDGKYHLQNWVDCMRSRKEPNCPVEEGVKSAAGAHLANQALKRV